MQKMGLQALRYLLVAYMRYLSHFIVFLAAFKEIQFMSADKAGKNTGMSVG